MPHLRQWMAMMLVDRPATFTPSLTTALAGIASSRGEPWPDIAPLVATVLGPDPTWNGIRRLATGFIPGSARSGGHAAVTSARRTSATRAGRRST